MSNFLESNELTEPIVAQLELLRDWLIREGCSHAMPSKLARVSHF
jgi:hypothetical protein